MQRYIVAAPEGSLLADIVQIAVSQFRPDARVEVCGTSSGLTLRITAVPSGNWMHLAADLRGTEVINAISEGATAVVALTGGWSDFADALTALDTGVPSIPPTVLLEMASRATGTEARRAAHTSYALIQREREVLALLSEGYSNAEIAARLGVSVNTVRTHLQSGSRSWATRVHEAHSLHVRVSLTCSMRPAHSVDVPSEFQPGRQSMLALYDESLLQDVLRLVLDQPAPFSASADLFAAACVTAAVRDPEWAAKVAASARPEVIALADRIVPQRPALTSPARQRRGA